MDELAAARGDDPIKLEPIGNIPPVEAEAAYYASLEKFAKLAA